MSDDAADDGNESEGRSPAEWVTFSVSLVILAVVVALIAGQMWGEQRPAAPAAAVAGEVREVDGNYYVPVEVTNAGDDTAENVQVVATLTIGDETLEGDQMVDFLSGGEVEDVEFVFDEDPAGGELAVSVSGYGLP
ncbi:MAG: TIGR02588 family protein [Actinomycetota bacterium]|nr:TIGR02588 family protein [Acidimicrobiia bacterium]MDQ3293974.1 TIGR02588 family protein [Actinomycetota bacterium]